MRYGLDISQFSQDYYSYLSEQRTFNLRFSTKCARFKDKAHSAQQLEQRLLEKQRQLLELREQFFQQLRMLKKINNQLASSNKQLQLEIFSLKLQLQKQRARSLMFSHEIQRLSEIRQPTFHSALRLLKLSLEKLQIQHHISTQHSEGLQLDRELSQIEQQLSKLNLLEDFVDLGNSQLNFKRSQDSCQKSLQNSFSQKLSLDND